MRGLYVSKNRSSQKLNKNEFRKSSLYISYKKKDSSELLKDKQMESSQEKTLKNQNTKSCWSKLCCCFKKTIKSDVLKKEKLAENNCSTGDAPFIEDNIDLLGSNIDETV